ncbi:zinc finger CCCH domain-containing protein 17-like [Impatiens glandulifera]|uniref:zinc finger CCCH domain-containing protein 17-like n=1 Tax=Impatiens glandulifera TaxID=253017 RepID=UPI001FB09211|nr:zinc finger CCCH domain-containing protein 17-like [Impatiens glandulifera]
MDDEFLKRSTDCVYFLASPLTCKKGIECEYRHSEIARLNPRDCWYWLSGSCLNPGCAFRHPPLDAGAEVSSEVTPSQNQSAPTSSKVNVPCYFFFNGTCNKGDRCSFSHGPDDNTPARKSLKIPTAVDTISSQTRKNPETNSEPHHDLFKSNSRQVVETQTQTPVIIPTKEDVRLSAPPTNNFTFNVPVQTHEDDSGEFMSEVLNRPTTICVIQSPRDQGGDGHFDGEDRLESSPGFDVLVDNGSDDAEYEDGQDYTLGLDHGLDADGRELNGQYGRYDYEEPIEYDPEYPHMGNNSREDEIRDSYPQINDENEYSSGRRTRERLSAPIFTRKRKNFPADYPSDDNRMVDLRYHLENRKQTNGGSSGQFARRQNAHHPQRLGYENRSGSRRQQQQPAWRPQRKLNEEGVNLLNENGWDRGGGGYRMNRPSNNNNNVRVSGGQDLNVENNYISSEGSGMGTPVPWKRRLGERSDLFTRPKTLAEIREEKEKFIGGETTTTMGREMMVCEDFEAPKPLSEILKDKNRLASVVEAKEVGNGSSQLS